MEYSLTPTPGLTIDANSRSSKSQDRRKEKTSYTRSIIVRDGTGSLNMDFYHARARALRSEATYSMFRKMFAPLFRRGS